MKSFHVDVEPFEGYLRIKVKYEGFIKAEEIFSQNILNQRAKIYAIFDCVDNMINEIKGEIEKGIVPTNVQEVEMCHENASAV